MASSETNHGLPFFITGCISAAFAVLTGAFAAHALKGVVSPEMLAAFETASRYQMYHALALLATAWVAQRYDNGRSRIVFWAGLSFVLGTVFFSGSLYVLVLTDNKWVGALTPIGGMMFIVGWVLLAWCAAKRMA